MVNKKNNSKFIKGFWIYFIVLFIIALACLVALWISLYKYQKKLDKTDDKIESLQDFAGDGEEIEEEKYVQAAFLNYVNGLGVSEWSEIYYSNHPDRFDKESDVQDFVNDRIISADADYYKSPDYSMASPRYLMMTEGETLAEFTLSGSDKIYTVNNVFLEVEGDKSIGLCAPANCQVTINGSVIPNPLPEESDTQVEGEAFSLDGYEESLDNPVIINNYTINCLLNEVNDISVEGALLSADGSFYEIVADSQYSEKALAFIKSLLNYYVAGKENMEGNLSAVLSHVARGSKAYKVLSESTSGMAFRTRDNAVYNTEVSDAYKAADNCVFVDVTYTNEREESTYGNDGGVYRVFFIDEGDGYKIVQFSGL